MFTHQGDYTKIGERMKNHLPNNLSTSTYASTCIGTCKYNTYTAYYIHTDFIGSVIATACFILYYSLPRFSYQDLMFC